jgi:hypothetical protein
MAWGLWFGGLATMFVVTRATFRESYELGRTANPIMFRAFEPYILVVAGVATVSALAWVWFSRSKLLKGVVVLLVLSAAASAYAHYGASLPMSRMSASTPEWKKLHGLSMALFASQAGLLAIAGLMLPAAVRGKKEE